MSVASRHRSGPERRQPPRLRPSLAGPVAAGFLVAAVAALPAAADAGRERIAQASPVVYVARVIVIEPATEIPLPIQIGAAETMPRNSFLRLRGLPAAASLSEGHQIGPGAWAVPLFALPNIRVKVPSGTAGKFELTINIVTLEGDLLTEVKTTLVVGSSTSLVARVQEQTREAPAAPQPTPSPVPAGRSGRPSAGGTGAETPPGQTTVTGAVRVPPLPARQGAASRSCGAPEITGSPLPAGRMRIAIKSACRAGELVAIDYAGAQLVRQLDTAGVLDHALDCFAGTGPKVEVVFADGTRRVLETVAADLDKVSKVAVVWRAPVNLDLHAYEYAAAHGEPGHVWAAAPSSAEAALKQTLATRRGRGFVSALDSGQGQGDKVEVYTFWHHDEQASGAVSMALDFETRGDDPSGELCGAGALSQVDFQVVMLSRQGQVTRERGLMLPMECGVRLERAARYNQSIIPVLRIRR